MLCHLMGVAHTRYATETKNKYTRSWRRNPGGDCVKMANRKMVFLAAAS